MRSERFTLSIEVCSGVLGCASMLLLAGCGVTVHPQTNACGWTQEFKAANSQELAKIADFESGIWTIDADGVITASKDSAIWLKGEYGDFQLDFEYRLDPAANSGVIIRCSDQRRWIPNSMEIQLLDDYAGKWAKDAPYLKCAGIYGHAAPTVQNVKPAGEWNRMTITAEGRRIRVAQNGLEVLDVDTSLWTSAKKNPDGTSIPSWLSRPIADLSLAGRIGFQGLHGGARPYFRNVQIRSL